MTRVTTNTSAHPVYVVDSSGNYTAPTTSVTGTITTATGGTPATVRGDFNVSFWGTFVATIVVERSFDAGTTWLPLTALGTAIAFTGPATEVFSEPQANVLYRIHCTAYTSGTINYRISQ